MGIGCIRLYFARRNPLPMSKIHILAAHTRLQWWRHQMEILSALLAICAGNSPVPSKFPAQRVVTRSFDVFFDLRLNKRLSKQSWGWWFETPSRPLWRHRNAYTDCARRKSSHLNDLSDILVVILFLFQTGNTTVKHEQKKRTYVSKHIYGNTGVFCWGLFYQLILA